MQYVGVAEAACRDLSRRRHRWNQTSAEREACWAPFWADFEWDPVEQNDLYFILETLSPFPSVLP